MNFIQFAENFGLIIRSVDYGKWKRVPTVDHPHKRNGAYIHTGDFAAVQNWAEMTEPAIWHPDGDAPKIDKAALAKRRAEDEARLRKTRQEAAKKAGEILAQCVQEKHAYLDAHGMPDERGLVYYPEPDKNNLVVPMYVDKRLVGCQTITRDGEKRFVYGQQCGMAEYIIGNSGVDWLVEGFCTGLALHKALKVISPRHRVRVCFSAGNLTKIGKTLKHAFICADHDVSRTGELAAIDTGHKYFLPPKEGTDFCDLWQELGTFQASQMLRKFLRNNLRIG